MPPTTPRRTPRSPFRRPALVELERRDVPAAYTVGVGGDVTTGFAANSLRGVLTSLAGSTDATNSINFALGATTITLAAALPAVTKNVSIAGQGAASTTVSGNGAVRVFDIDGPNTIVVGLTGLTLTKGSTAASGLFGGAVRVTNEQVTFTNVVLSDSTAYYGGLVAATGSATLAFAGCTLTGGVATGDSISGSAGGAVYLNNTATVNVANSTLFGNRSDASGGAVAFNLGGFLACDQTTFSDNRVTSTATTTVGGGAVALSDVTAGFRNCTLTNNGTAAGTGGAIRVAGSSVFLSLTSTIVAGNTAAQGGADVASPNGSVSATYSLIGVAGAGSGVTLATDTNNLKGTTTAPLAPGLLPLADNGGQVRTHLPLASSPAIDTGSNPQGATTDARGAGFPRELPTGKPDIGAAEGAPPTLTVTTLADTVANDGVLSLREAILAANYAADSNTIAFQAGLTGTVTLTSALPTLATSAAVQGAGATVTVSGAGKYRPFDLNAPGVATVVFSDLTITNGTAASGGAVRVADESVTFTNVVLSDSTAGDGGLVAAADSAALTFTGSTLSGGVANGFGGAVWFGKAGTLTLAGSTLSGNAAGKTGGAVYFRQGSLTVDQATFAGNQAAGGGALAVEATATVAVRNSTLTGNTAGATGGGAIRLNSAAATVTLAGTIVAGNTATGAGPDVSNPAGTVNATASLIGVAGANSGLTLTTDANNQKGTTTTPLDPQLGPLANNGGPVSTRVPLAGSPVIDKGSNTPGFTTDARGAGFPRELPTGLPDIGATEYDAPTVTVTTLADTVDGTDGVTSLREAILAANGRPGSTTIAFQPGLGGTIALTAALPTITASGMIRGGGAAVTVSGIGTYRPFTITVAGVGGEFAISDVTITQGFGGSTGGAVRVADETVTFTNVVLSDSTATTSGGLVYLSVQAQVAFVGCTLANGTSYSNGGAVATLDGSVSFTGCTLAGNTAWKSGGAVSTFGVGTLACDQTTFSGNQAATNDSAGGGGAIDGGVTTTIRNSTFTNNAAGTGGGAIRLVGSRPVSLVSSVVAGNTAAGGADPDFVNTGGTLSATNSLIGVAGTGLTLAADSANNQTGTAAAPLNPLLGPLADNGGRVRTHLPLTGSPAVDAGSNPAGFTTDARGAGYPRELPTGRPDAGAVEANLATITVTTLADTTVAADGKMSLREAIGYANALPDVSTIVFLPGLTGTITLTSDLPALTTSLAVQGAGAAVTVSGGGLYRPFDVNSPSGVSTVTFSDLTITKGRAANGGAVRVVGERVLFTTVALTDSTAATGGLIDLSGTAAVTFVGCTLAGGNAATDGGAVYAAGNDVVAFVNSTLSGNAAGNRGGAVCFVNTGRLTADQATFSGNAAGTATATAGGGAVFLAGTVAAVRNSTFTGNSGGNDGGGAIRLGGGFPTLSLVSTIVAGNTAAGGAAPDIANPFGTVAAYDSLIGAAGAGSGLTLTTDSNNQKGTAASVLNPGLLGLANNGGPVKTHALAVGSPARDRGSNATGVPFDARGPGFPRERPAGRPDVGALEAASSGPLATLAAGTLTAPGGATYAFTVTYSDESPINVATVNGTPTVVAVTGPGGTVAVTAAVADVAADGPIRTVTYTVAAPGGTWDAADNGAYTVTLAANQAKTTAGVAVPGGVLGTFAVQATGVAFTVTNTNDTGPGSLRAAVEAANASAGVPDAIAFDPTVFNVPRTITLSSGEVQITDSVAIRGPGAAKLTLDAGAVGGRRAFTVNGAGTLAVAVSGLTVTGGRGDFGGAVAVPGDESVTFTNVAFTNNAASGSGGAISVGNAAATLTLDGCTFDANTATFNGGAVNLQAAATLVVRASSFTGNAGATGGAVSFVAGGVAAVAGATFAGNVAAARGGAVYFFGSGGSAQLTFTNCTLDGNAVTGVAGDAAPSGGAIFLSAFTGSLSLVQSTVTGNVAPAGRTGAGVGVFTGAGTVFAVNSIVAGNRTADATPAAADFGSAVGTALLATNLAYTGGLAGVTLVGTATAGFDVASNLNPLAFNGGPTRTRSLKAGSAAIDASPVLPPLSTDQRGAGFARVVNGAADLGAVEVPPPDTTAPTASGSFATVTTRKGAAYAFTITLADNVAVNAGSVQGADFTVTGPNGYSAAATLLGLTSGGNTTPLTASLSVTPPGGAWDAGDNGTYTVSLTGSVTDTSGNAAATGSLGTFAVQAPVAVQSVATKLSDGTTTSLTTAGQRSAIPNLVVTYDGLATGANLAASYKLLNTSTNATVAVNVSTTTVAGKTVATVTPVAPLANAYYTFTAFGTAVTTANLSPLVVGLDGDDNGTAGGNYTLAFHRFAGDVTGDTAVDGDDLGQLAQAFNSVAGDSTYRAYLDLDGDGAVDGNDLAIFAQSFALGVL